MEEGSIMAEKLRSTIPATACDPAQGRRLRRAVPRLEPRREPSPLGMTSKLRLEQLDGLRGPLCVLVIAINMELYNAGANTPVGFFLVLSGLTSFLAYHEKTWDNTSRAKFFERRLLRLLPMLLVSTSLQLCACVPWALRPGVVIPGASSGGVFNFAVTALSLALMLAGSGAICRGTACGCCQIDRWPRPPCSLFPVILGTYLTGPGWYACLCCPVSARCPALAHTAASRTPQVRWPPPLPERILPPQTARQVWRAVACHAALLDGPRRLGVAGGAAIWLAIRRVCRY